MPKLPHTLTHTHTHPIFCCPQATEEAQASLDAQAEDEQAGPKKLCKNVHAWVLVMPGKRNVSEPLFIETTTVSACLALCTCGCLPDCVCNHHDCSVIMAMSLLCDYGRLTGFMHPGCGY